jgi:hypothetical protein
MRTKHLLIPLVLPAIGVVILVSAGTAGWLIHRLSHRGQPATFNPGFATGTGGRQVVSETRLRCLRRRISGSGATSPAVLVVHLPGRHAHHRVGRTRPLASRPGCVGSGRPGRRTPTRPVPTTAGPPRRPVHRYRSRQRSRRRRGAGRSGWRGGCRTGWPCEPDLARCNRAMKLVHSNTSGFRCCDHR